MGFDISKRTGNHLIYVHQECPQSLVVMKSGFSGLFHVIREDAEDDGAVSHLMKNKEWIEKKFSISLPEDLMI